MKDQEMFDRFMELSVSQKDCKRMIHFRDSNGYRIFKYNKAAFFSRAWEDTPEIALARGIVFDIATKTVVCRPFDRAEEIELDRNDRTPIIAEYKVNGFMASVWFHNGKWHISTTGSLESDFVRLAAVALQHTCSNLKALSDKAYVMHNGEKVPVKDLTLLFEICHQTDPHIISEQLDGDGSSVWLIGARITAEGSGNHLLLPDALDTLAFEHLECYRGNGYVTCMSEIFENRNDFRFEGFMIRDQLSGNILGKYKSPFYKTLKYLSRSKKLSAESKDASCWSTVNKDFSFLVDAIWNNGEADLFVNVLTEQQRLRYLKSVCSQRDADIHKTSELEMYVYMPDTLEETNNG